MRTKSTHYKINTNFPKVMFTCILINVNFHVVYVYMYLTNVRLMLYM